ncbi:retrovirus-related pol polyprotein from transposon TNT 1-94 [Tanacetum coccineum]
MNTDPLFGILILENDSEASSSSDELNEFERLKVWELISRPDKVMVITLKWIYKVKLDELGGILKNKARLVAHGYRQEERIDFDKILGNILTQHPLRFALTASASILWIYIQQVWHTLRLDDYKERFIFFIDTKEFTFLVDDLRRMFQLPQTTDNNHARFIEPPTFTVMLLFCLNELGYATQIRLPGQFATKDLSQLW